MFSIGLLALGKTSLRASSRPLGRQQISYRFSPAVCFGHDRATLLQLLTCMAVSFSTQIAVAAAEALVFLLTLKKTVYRIKSSGSNVPRMKYTFMFLRDGTFLVQSR